MSLHLEQSFDTISKLTDVAINEYALETALEKMATEMRARSFSLTPHRDTCIQIDWFVSISFLFI